jgi:hypothetical protein
VCQDYCREGEIVTIDGLGQRQRVAGKRYNYAADKCRCPVCGGIGYPWAGWFNCDDCPAKALVETGEVFMPVSEAPAVG